MAQLDELLRFFRVVQLSVLAARAFEGDVNLGRACVHGYSHCSIIDAVT